ncbi:hypothetical protein [Dactylosporangium salmoneum]|uniref:Uncharacterized protein n=1 Tax=Dactylosporangium salmoneum TaxID=53361 RepID=A0ABP5SCE9_9ACTN
MKTDEYLAALTAYDRAVAALDGTADRVRAAQGKARLAAQETEEAILARMDRLARDVDRRCAEAQRLLGGAAGRLLGDLAAESARPNEPSDPEAAIPEAHARHVQDYEALRVAVEADRVAVRAEPTTAEPAPRARGRSGLIAVLVIAALAVAAVAYLLTR